MYMETLVCPQKNKHFHSHKLQEHILSFENNWEKNLHPWRVHGLLAIASQMPENIFIYLIVYCKRNITGYPMLSKLIPIYCNRFWMKQFF